MIPSDEELMSVLDFSKPVNVPNIDKVVRCVYGENQQVNTGVQMRALAVLSDYKKHTDAWTHADRILWESQEPAAKYLALQTLDDMVNTRWHILPRDQQLGVRNFVVNIIMKLAQNPAGPGKDRVLIEKLNDTLVQVLKKEWPANWPTFIDDIVKSARASDAVLENNLAIIRQLSETIFDFSKGKMTQHETQVRKDALNSEFSKIFQMVDYILRSKGEPRLIISGLECLLACLSWIPLGYIFETDLIELLSKKFLPVPITRNSALRCLTEIASLTFDPANPAAAAYEGKLASLHAEFISLLCATIPTTGTSHRTTVVHFFENKSVNGATNRDECEQFIQNAAQFLIHLYTDHLPALEKPGTPDAATSLELGHRYLLGITCVDDKEVFKSCAEYWAWLTSALFHSGWNGGRSQAVFDGVLGDLRKVMIGKMARPEEVIVFEDENGEVVKESLKDVDAIALYETMRQTLVYLTHLNCEGTESIMLNALTRLSVQSQTPANFPLGQLATLSWAIGSISGTMRPPDEDRFLVNVITDLLKICGQRDLTSEKASIASDIMYVVGQYPRFLKANWDFLKTVVNKLFDFMQETYEGVQDMAVETFLKITHSCSGMFVTVHKVNGEPFIAELLRNMLHHTHRLQRNQCRIFYEAVGLMIAAAPPQLQEGLVQQYMAIPNRTWVQIMANAATTPAVLQEQEVMIELAHCLKIYVRGALSVGPGFRQQVFQVFTDMMKLYGLYAQVISQEVAAKGANVTRFKHVRAMRIVKKESLRFIEAFVKYSPSEADVSGTILPPLLDTVLTDYNQSVVDARDPQVLSLVTVLVKKLPRTIEPHVPKILDAILNVTLEMLNTDTQGFPEHRTHFFRLLQALNADCFPAFLKALQMSPAIMDAIISAMKHSKREIETIGLDTLLQFLQSISMLPVAFDFYQVYFFNLLYAVFNVVTDTLHKTGFKMHCKLLQHLITTSIRAAKAGRQVSNDQQPGVSADQFVKQHLAQQLSSFPNLKPAQIQRFVEGLYLKLENDAQFKEHVRDFLIELQEFAVGDNTELYDDQQQADRAAKTEEQNKRQQVPGMAPQPKVYDLMLAANQDDDMD
ncbi:Exportin-1 [Diplonema papillatum]|nr:Exportin-1 [Diplonema papillatum]